MKEPIFNASLTIEATPEEAEALNKSNSTVDEETRQTFRHALEMQEASLPKGRIARLKASKSISSPLPFGKSKICLSAIKGAKTTQKPPSNTIKRFFATFTGLLLIS